ncbi:MAG: hypothetical protein IT371_23485 [Deltaproteobacteria bacterium]|nr:hypothetical protein [Deltaproteobacteria bacterium]
MFKSPMIAAPVLLVGLFCGCVDAKSFVSQPDAAPAVDAAPDALTSWPDMVVPTGDLPTYVGARAMFAHSGKELFSIDPATLALSKVGPFGAGIPDMNDLAVTPAGELYGVSVNELFRIDATTAKASRVTAVPGTANVALTFEAAGTLLAADKSGALRRIDPQNGNVTPIGSFGPGFEASGDLVAIKDGTLYGVSDAGADKTNNILITVDPQTGKATRIGQIGFDHVWGLAYWKGTIYGLTKSGALLSIDPKTGKGQRVQNYPYEFWGAAVTPLAPIDK